VRATAARVPPRDWVSTVSARGRVTVAVATPNEAARSVTHASQVMHEERGRQPSLSGPFPMRGSFSESCGVHPPCGFDSLLRHQPSLPSGLPLSSESYGWASQLTREGCPAEAVGGRPLAEPHRGSGLSGACHAQPTPGIYSPQGEDGSQDSDAGSGPHRPRHRRRHARIRRDAGAGQLALRLPRCRRNTRRIPPPVSVRQARPGDCWDRTCARHDARSCVQYTAWRGAPARSGAGAGRTRGCDSPRAWLAGPDERCALGRTAGHVDASITMDSSFEFQPRLDGLAFGGGVIHARSNRMADLVPIIDSVLVARTRRSGSENGRDAARHARPSPGGPLTSIVSDPKLPSGE